MDAKGIGLCIFINEHYRIAGSRTNKKFHVIDSEFASKFEISPPDEVACHSEMQNINDTLKEAMVEYVLALTVADFEICVEGVPRPMVQEDLTQEEDYTNPAN